MKDGGGRLKKGFILRISSFILPPSSFHRGTVRMTHIRTAAPVAVAAFAIALFARTIAAEEVAVEPAEVDRAIERGLAFLAKDAIAWKNEHNCASCHHASLVVWSMREAKLR